MAGGGAPDRTRAEAAAAIIGSAAEVGAPLGALTTYRVGGSAAVLVRARSAEDLARVAEAAAGTGLAVASVGKGSNLLVADRGFAGIVVRLAGPRYSAITRDGDRVEAGAAADLPVVARRTVQWSLAGFEWAVGVPGSVGGGVRMNAGGHGSDMAAVVESATVVDLASGSLQRWPAAELGFGYRSSAVGTAQLVTGARLALTPGDRERGETLVAEIVRWRRANQPGGQNAGSVFTNPEGDAAGRLVDACGLKGLRVGTAKVSPKHANFIQADPGGRSGDVLALIGEVRRRVLDRTGVDLVPEVQLLGFDETDGPGVEP